MCTRTANYFLPIFSSAYALTRRSGHPSRTTSSLLPLSVFSARLFFLESLHFPSWRSLCTRSCPPPPGFGLYSSISLDFKALKQVSKSRPRKNRVPSLPSPSTYPSQGASSSSVLFFVLLVVFVVFVVIVVVIVVVVNVVVVQAYDKIQLPKPNLHISTLNDHDG